MYASLKVQIFIFQHLCFLPVKDEILSNFFLLYNTFSYLNTTLKVVYPPSQLTRILPL
mgnify:CR=1 FL=1